MQHNLFNLALTISNLSYEYLRGVSENFKYENISTVHKFAKIN